MSITPHENCTWRLNQIHRPVRSEISSPISAAAGGSERADVAVPVVASGTTIVVAGPNDPELEQLPLTNGRVDEHANVARGSRCDNVDNVLASLMLTWELISGSRWPMRLFERWRPWQRWCRCVGEYSSRPLGRVRSSLMTDDVREIPMTRREAAPCRITGDVPS
eukprot:330986-Prymnesium_polylepis.1